AKGLVGLRVPQVHPRRSVRTHLTASQIDIVRSGCERRRPSDRSPRESEGQMQTDSTRRRDGLVPTPVLLRVNAAIDAVVGVVLLAATWNGLYEELDSIGPVPYIWAQL